MSELASVLAASQKLSALLQAYEDLRNIFNGSVANMFARFAHHKMFSNAKMWAYVSIMRRLTAIYGPRHERVVAAREQYVMLARELAEFNAGVCSIANHDMCRAEHIAALNAHIIAAQTTLDRDIDKLAGTDVLCDAKKRAAFMSCLSKYLLVDLSARRKYILHTM